MRALLIQKDVKQCLLHFSRFHSLRALLIQKDVKRRSVSVFHPVRLRALLIQKDVKQINSINGILNLYESFVNSERCKTEEGIVTPTTSLRALLIQKDVKPSQPYSLMDKGLRALLIQKDVKLHHTI